MREQRSTENYTIYKNGIDPEWRESKTYDWRQRFFMEFSNFLNAEGFNAKIENRKSFDIELDGSEKSEIPIRDSLAVIQNDRTKRYYVIDCHDWTLQDDIELLVRDHRCVKILRCQYHRQTLSDEKYDKIEPWTYFDRFWPTKEEQLVECRKIESNQNNLYFRGFAWGPRAAIFEELMKKGIVNPDIQHIDLKAYMRECSEHRIMLSLPGMGEICHRDIEGFAKGTCVMRPKLHIEFHNNLIPDYHYISVDMNFWWDTPAEIADKIIRRYYEVIDDHELLDSVAANAMRWYDENVRLNNVLRLTGRLLDLC